MTVGVSVVLLSILILTVATFAVVNDGSSLFQFAYAQTPDPGANPNDPLAADNSTNSMPSDNSTDLGMPSDNSTTSDLAPTDPSADLGMPNDNTTSIAGDNTTSSSTSNLTSNAAVPEFGPLASIVLVISVLSILVFSAKTKLKF